jgi:tRNA nucleotidyltransferase (CCA-adding enzyme)
MNILVGHTNMDMDCIGSIVLGKYLYPDYQAVKSRLIHPVAQNLYSLYKKRLNFIQSKELSGKIIDNMVVFDTRSQSRVKEYLELLQGPWSGNIIIYDHHHEDTSDINNATIIEGFYGANTTLVALELIKKNIVIDSEAATIALSGLFADTGNFTHTNIKPEDFHVAEWLMSSGANIKLVREFVNALNQDYQINLFHQVLNRIQYKNIHGNSVILCHLPLKEQVNGLAAIAEKVFEIENPDALFIVFGFQKEKSALIVSRSNTEAINLSQIMSHWGGGGHAQASAASVKGDHSDKLFSDLSQFLVETLAPALRAEEIMTKSVYCINENWSILEASLFLEKVAHTGAPVTDQEENLTGIITLRDISKARKASQMNAPVKSYMSRKLQTCNINTSLKDIGRILGVYNVGHLPVTRNNKVVGLITRTDYLHQWNNQYVSDKSL